MKKFTKVLLFSSLLGMLFLPTFINSNKKSVEVSADVPVPKADKFISIYFDKNLIDTFVDNYGNVDNEFTYRTFGSSSYIEDSYLISSDYYFKFVGVKCFYFPEDNVENGLSVNSLVHANNNIYHEPITSCEVSWSLALNNTRKMVEFYYYVDSDDYYYFDLTGGDEYNAVGFEMVFQTNQNIYSNASRFVASLYFDTFSTSLSSLQSAFLDLRTAYNNLVRDNNLLQTNYDTLQTDYDALSNQFDSLSSTSGIFDLIGSAFNSIGGFLSIEIAPFITLGMLFAVPIVVFIIIAVVKMIGGGD